ncbi:PTS sugar transporter subunit IIC [Lentilactobacillus parakefiri]|uniref:Mannose-specific PTS system IIC component n=1 Tax=Lentilactobacillus parakefiri TaxID=152332 RepID=A0A224V702_9LACO|nr:PTS sugar transporter subunit IIC [Lentilactobacillus parakefiri]PAL00119.1 PTS mannose/fructose/sorbose transporter subunit IIC [Lentilactobacillus parakefiri]TDG92174.1 hypothetical protein C5L28_002240 [Lentilactobacillus parakefiri]GAW72836.1 mannose-specific PTS system IIC component [Lentilactobacillus parakefiri]
MSVVSMGFVLLIAFVVGMDGILDEWQVYQPIIACTLIGLATGHAAVGITLGAILQMITIGWINIGASVALDIALSAVVSALLVCGPAALSIKHGIALAIPFAVIGQVLNVTTRKSIVKFVHTADQAAEDGQIRQIDRIHLVSLGIQGLRVLIPTGLIMLISPQFIHQSMQQIPAGITNGISISIGMVSAVGFANLINMMVSRSLWIWFIIGFLVAVFTKVNLFILVGLGLIVAVSFVWAMSKRHGSSGGGNNGDDLDDFDKELDDL